MATKQYIATETALALARIQAATTTINAAITPDLPPYPTKTVIGQMAAGRSLLGNQDQVDLQRLRYTATVLEAFVAELS